jgi:hypothetical protein
MSHVTPIVSRPFSFSVVELGQKQGEFPHKICFLSVATDGRRFYPRNTASIMVARTSPVSWPSRSSALPVPVMSCHVMSCQRQTQTDSPIRSVEITIEIAKNGTAVQFRSISANAVHTCTHRSREKGHQWTARQRPLRPPSAGRQRVHAHAPLVKSTQPCTM